MIAEFLKDYFSILKLDLKSIYYIPRIIKASKLGDAAILKEIIKILNHQRIRTISSISYNPELTLKKGIYSSTKPNKPIFPKEIAHGNKKAISKSKIINKIATK